MEETQWIGCRPGEDADAWKIVTSNETVSAPIRLGSRGGDVAAAAAKARFLVPPPPDLRIGKLHRRNFFFRRREPPAASRKSLPKMVKNGDFPIEKFQKSKNFSRLRREAGGALHPLRGKGQTDQRAKILHKAEFCKIIRHRFFQIRQKWHKFLKIEPSVPSA